MVNYLCWLVFLLCLASIVYYSYGIYAALSFFHPSSSCDITFLPPVTLLKPLCGLDVDMYETLASCCQQDYPAYQIIFTVKEATDPSISIVKKLQQSFPNVDLKLVVSDRLTGANLKISNLANGIEYAKHSLLILADSDIKVEPNYLKAIVQPFADEKVGVVTCLYRSKSQGIIAEFEALGIATQFHPSVLVARLIEGIRYSFGSTIAIRKTVLEEIGGLGAVANYLADDYQLGYLPYQAGYQVILSNYIVEHHLDTSNLAELIQRQSRWLRCIRVERLWSYLGLMITHGIPLGIIFLGLSQASLIGWITLSLIILLRFFLAWLVGIYYFQDSGVKKWFYLIPLRDLFSFIIWFYGLFSNTICWRGQSFKLLKGGTMIPKKESVSSRKFYPKLLSKS